jgi:hypothetical protein
MDTAPLKSYAPAARREFLQAVADRAAHYGLTATKIEPVTVRGDVALIAGEAFPARIAPLRKALEERIARDGFDVTIEAIAYTWFNRLVALRYMELAGYLDHGLRVLSHPAGDVQPEILEQAARVDLPGLDKQQVIDLKLDGTKQEELYRLLLVAQCNALSAAMPFLFERINDATELLLPANLLASDSVVRTLIEAIPEALWADIEIIGWLYQFYIAEKKDEVIGKVVKSEDIPAATQLFTPNWIVKYMVQNSLGATWLATYPASPLKSQMEFYIEPAEQTPEVQAQLAAITPESLDPEALTLIDPASGSGHILVEAYDLFKAIYLERGYRQRDIPELILTKNLYGLDICPRAAQLTGFALLMKGRADDRRLLDRERGIRLNVMPLVNSTDLDVERLASGVDLAAYGLELADLQQLADLFEHATTFGSLIQVPPVLAEKLPALARLAAATSDDLFVAEDLRRLGPLVRQAEVLARQYDAVVANPPYMGSKYYCDMIDGLVASQFKTAASDLYACFMLAALGLCRPSGWVSQINIPGWMQNSSFRDFRTELIARSVIISLVHNGRGVFGADFGSCAFAIRNMTLKGMRGRFRRLFEKPSTVLPNEVLRERFGQATDFVVAASEFNAVPDAPFTYQASRSVRAAFIRFPSISDLATACQGLSTSNDQAFVRHWHEVSLSRSATCQRRNGAGSTAARWFPYNKGGTYRKWAGNFELVIDWENDGARIKSQKPKSVIRNERFYFRQSVSWQDYTIGSTSFRHYPEGFIFATNAHSAFCKQQGCHKKLLAFCNTAVMDVISATVAPGVHFNSGYFSLIPFMDSIVPAEAEAAAGKCVGTATTDWDAYERSWDFQRLPLLTVTGPDGSACPSLEASYSAWLAGNRRTIAEMKRLEEENNRLFIDAYGLADELTPDVPIDQITLTVNPAYRYGASLTDAEWSVEHGFGEDLEARFRTDTCEELISYAIGCMMGRYSLDEPGLVYAHAGNEGFDPSRYTSFPADDDGIIPVTDFAWFDDDACNRLVQFLSVAWPADRLEENLAFLAAGLGPKKGEPPRETIRRYLAGGFYKQHLQAYKNRPIYWLFSSGKKGAFQCLVYLHRYHEGTLSRMRTQYVVPLLGKLSGRIGMLTDTIAKASSTSVAKKAQKERDALAKQQAELQAFDEQLNHYASLRISLDLDDGVKVNYAKFGTLLADVKKVSGTSGDD